LEHGILHAAEAVAFFAPEEGDEADGEADEEECNDRVSMFDWKASDVDEDIEIQVDATPPPTQQPLCTFTTSPTDESPTASTQSAEDKEIQILHLQIRLAELTS
jgi:hypothetical protein